MKLIDKILFPFRVIFLVLYILVVLFIGWIAGENFDNI